jgi:hypothetical protein
VDIELVWQFQIIIAGDYLRRFLDALLLPIVKIFQRFAFFSSPELFFQCYEFPVRISKNTFTSSAIMYMF